jgi:hypothetical protein
VNDKMPMSRLILLLLPLSLGGRLSFRSSNRPPPNQATIVVPSGSAVVCSNGSPHLASGDRCRMWP